MTSLSIPLSGLNAAVTRLNGAAERIVQAPVAAEPGTAAVSGGAGGPPQQSRVAGLHTGGDGSLAGAIVDLKIAEHAYKTNIVALRTMAETQDSLLEITL